MSADQRHQQSADERTHLKRKVLGKVLPPCTAKPSGASMYSASCSVSFRITATSVPLGAVGLAHAGVTTLDSLHIHAIRSACLRCLGGWRSFAASAQQASRGTRSSRTPDSSGSGRGTMRGLPPRNVAHSATQRGSSSRIPRPNSTARVRLEPSKTKSTNWPGLSGVASRKPASVAVSRMPTKNDNAQRWKSR